MIIGSTLQIPSNGKDPPSDVIPQAPANMSDNDRQVLTELGIPRDQWNNHDAIVALHNRTAAGVVSVLVSKSGEELSRSHVLEQVEFLLKNAEQAG